MEIPGRAWQRPVSPPGRETLLHRHRKTEEIYHIAEGRGVMTLGKEVFTVAVGDSVYIPPEMPHRIKNRGRA